MFQFNFIKVLSHLLNPYRFDMYEQSRITQVDDGEYDDLRGLSRDEALEMLRVNALGMAMTFPLDMKPEGGEWWQLPFEPLISVTGKNVIVKKPVSKGAVRGSIKERWSQDDYVINIEGILMNTVDDSYPQDDVMRLRRLLEAGSLEVRSPLLELFSVSRIVIESWEFPMTTGPKNQAYKISAVSDDIYRLLLKGDDLKRQ